MEEGDFFVGVGRLYDDDARSIMTKRCNKIGAELYNQPVR